LNGAKIQGFLEKRLQYSVPRAQSGLNQQKSGHFWSPLQDCTFKNEWSHFALEIKINLRKAVSGPSIYPELVKKVDNSNFHSTSNFKDLLKTLLTPAESEKEKKKIVKRIDFNFFFKTFRTPAEIDFRNFSLFFPKTLLTPA
jgi:hypothetical protein